VPEADDLTGSRSLAAISASSPTTTPNAKYGAGKRVIDLYSDDITVQVWGTQTPEGQVYRHIDVAEGGYERLTMSSAAHTRAFCQALIAAADEVDLMASRDPITA
jgi:hypothetical protein